MRTRYQESALLSVVGMRNDTVIQTHEAGSARPRRADTPLCSYYYSDYYFIYNIKQRSPRTAFQRGHHSAR